MFNLIPFFLFLVAFGIAILFLWGGFQGRKIEQGIRDRGRKLVAELEAEAKAERKKIAFQTVAHSSKSYVKPRVINEWEKVFIPKTRPSGKWVNWKYGTGWVKVAGSQHCFEEVEKVIDFLGTFIPDSDTIGIELIRTPENPHDINAVEVWAYCQPAGRNVECYQLGFIERDAAEWLAHTFDDEMPIGAELKKFSENGEAASITIAALMPPKRKRKKFTLE